MPKKKKTYLQKSWLDQEQYKDWLVEAPEDTNAKCKLCKKSVQTIEHGRRCRKISCW